jgi:hypothetical protein
MEFEENAEEDGLRVVNLLLDTLLFLVELTFNGFERLLGLLPLFRVED